MSFTCAPLSVTPQLADFIRWNLAAPRENGPERYKRHRLLVRIQYKALIVVITEPPHHYLSLISLLFHKHS